MVDAFMKAARRCSLDATTAEKGGLLGVRLPQGSIKLSKEIDKTMFTAPLGVVYGPIESEYGNHLVLVEERLGCPRLDEGFTRIVAEPGESGVKSVLRGPSRDGDDGTLSETDLVGLLVFFVAVGMGGGILAEIAAAITASWSR